MATPVLFVAVTLRLSTVDLLSALPAYPVVAVLLAGAAIDGDWWAFVRALIGGSVLFAFFFALGYVYPAGIGFGDHGLPDRRGRRTDPHGGQADRP